jgi:hypothetical protein
MACGRGRSADRLCALNGAAASHSAELVSGDYSSDCEGPLIRPSGTFSPRGEGISCLSSIGLP